MRRRFRLWANSAALLLAVLALSVAPARAQVWPCGVSRPTAYAHEQLTVGAAAVGLTASVYTTDAAGNTGISPAAAHVLVLTAAINMIDDGTTATASIGHVIQPNVDVWVCYGSVGRVSMIRNGASSATVNVIYYRPSP